MKRFGGVMDSTSMEKQGQYFDAEGKRITIQAGSEGWTILYEDGRVQSADVEDDATLNFMEAKSIAEAEIGCKLRISLDEPVQAL